MYSVVVCIYTCFGVLSERIFESGCVTVSSHPHTPAHTSLIYNYDRTCKESLYSTYPYLTYSNEKSTSPVMKKYSMLGYREKINIEAIAKCCGEEQCWEIIPSWHPSVHFEQAPPPTLYSHPFQTQTPLIMWRYYNHVSIIILPSNIDKHRVHRRLYIFNLIINHRYKKLNIGGSKDTVQNTWKGGTIVNCTYSCMKYSWLKSDGLW